MRKKSGWTIACLGDSLTAGNPGSAYVPRLRNRLPGDVLINRGRGGETVLSLHRRLKGDPAPDPWDIALLWVGVNDVFARVTPWRGALKLLRRQPWARDPDEFVRRYSRLFDLVSGHADRLLLVPPLLIGEDVDNPWNRELGEMSRRIEDLASRRPNAIFSRLRSVFLERLEGRETMPYVPRRAMRVLRDALRSPAGRRKARSESASGLILTVDGVHLNREGAQLAANVLAREIKALRSPRP